MRRGCLQFPHVQCPGGERALLMRDTAEGGTRVSSPSSPSNATYHWNRHTRVHSRTATTLMLSDVTVEKHVRHVVLRQPQLLLEA
eukprot:4439195-Prymnesium_polylepis.1